MLESGREHSGTTAHRRQLVRLTYKRPMFICVEDTSRYTLQCTGRGARSRAMWCVHLAPYHPASLKMRSGWMSSTMGAQWFIARNRRSSSEIGARGAYAIRFSLGSGHLVLATVQLLNFSECRDERMAFNSFCRPYADWVYNTQPYRQLLKPTAHRYQSLWMKLNLIVNADEQRMRPA